MKMVIEIDDEQVLFDIRNRGLEAKSETDKVIIDALYNGTPLPEHLNKIKDDIGRYELDCRFADYSQTDACTICNKNVFESIYRIIDNRLAESEGSDSE